MRFELIEGHTLLLGRMVNDGWELINTFPNPYPQPYFFALLRLNTKDPDSYDLRKVKEESRLAMIEEERSRPTSDIPF